MNREPTTFYMEKEFQFEANAKMQWTDTWNATPAEALKLCAMAFTSMCDRGHAPVEFSPQVLHYLDADVAKRLNVFPVEGTDYHTNWLGVQGIGFVHHAYNKALRMEQKAELDAAQLRDANQLLAELNSYLRLNPIEQIRYGNNIEKRLSEYLAVHNVSPAGV